MTFPVRDLQISLPAHRVADDLTSFSKCLQASRDSRERFARLSRKVVCEQIRGDQRLTVDPHTVVVNIGPEANE
jgi:hypothetical protein